MPAALAEGMNNKTINPIKPEARTQHQGLKPFLMALTTKNHTQLLVKKNNLGTDNYQVLLEDIQNRNQGPSQRDCPTGYVPVPGNAIYNTNYASTGGFCVMKYEAKVDENSDGIGDSNVSCIYDGGSYNTWKAVNSDGTQKTGCDIDFVNRTIVSSAQGYPLTYIAQDYSSDYIDAKRACAGLGNNYHLITNGEWMTIVRNIELQPQNWSSGVVGQGQLKSGNTGTAYTNGSYDGANPEYTAKTSADETAKLVLSNGSEVWDLSGNVWEWVDKTSTLAEQPDLAFDSNDELFTGGSYVEYSGSYTYDESTKYLVGSDYFNYKDYRSINSLWNSGQGIGRIYTNSNSTSTSVRAWLRGGHWFYGTSAGALALSLSNDPSLQHYLYGLRCVVVP